MQRKVDLVAVGFRILCTYIYLTAHLIVVARCGLVLGADPTRSNLLPVRGSGSGKAFESLPKADFVVLSQEANY